MATWNIGWAPTTGKRGPLVQAKLREVDADLLVVTEGQRGLLPEGGHVVDAGDDWGYDVPADRRKTILWSHWPLTDVVRFDDGAGKGRIVAARTGSPIGEIQVLGVCIPWTSAHVTTGRRDATNWSEHLECCDQIEELAASFDPGIPTIVAGDFNQRIPRQRQPLRVAQRLSQVMSRWTVHTAGETEHGPQIDHIASTLACAGVVTWAARADDVALSDHSGVACRLGRPTSQR